MIPSIIRVFAYLILCGIALDCFAETTVPASSLPAIPTTGIVDSESPAIIAIVVNDQVALRAAPRSLAQQQAMLWQGDVLEIRGERLDYLQVYDHRRERGGFVHTSLVRKVSLASANASELLAVVRFLRDMPGSETLGIAYTAAYLKAAPATAIDAEPFAALGTMAERLARSASAQQNNGNETAIAAHLEVAAAYGVKIRGFEREGRMQLCYDGEAFRRVLAMSSLPEERARAALALTRYECIDPAMSVSDRQRFDEWCADVLDHVDLVALSGYLKNRLWMRRAGVWASVAFAHARRGESPQPAADRALQSLLAVNKAEFTDEDKTTYTDAAVRASASRWAGELPGSPETSTSQNSKLGIVTTTGKPGETCVALVDATHPAANPLLTRCTYGTVWANSVSVNAAGTVLALAVQPLATWRELWIFRATSNGWVADVIPPATGEPELGVIEFAGWVPGSAQMLAAREAKIDGRFTLSFEIINLDTLASEKQANSPKSLTLFYRWQDPAWKRQTLTLR